MATARVLLIAFASTKTNVDKSTLVVVSSADAIAEVILLYVVPPSLVEIKNPVPTNTENSEDVDIATMVVKLTLFILDTYVSGVNTISEEITFIAIITIPVVPAQYIYVSPFVLTNEVLVKVELDIHLRFPIDGINTIDTVDKFELVIIVSKANVCFNVLLTIELTEESAVPFAVAVDLNVKYAKYSKLLTLLHANIAALVFAVLVPISTIAIEVAP